MKTYPEVKTITHSYNQLIEGFKAPAEEYNPVLMWFWNDRVTKEGITYQLEKFREQNIINFFIHTSYGFPFEYLGEEYFELIKYVVSEAKRLGMKYWIYDEIDWPSGNAGGKVVKAMPEAAQTELRCFIKEYGTDDLQGTMNRFDFRGKLLCVKRRNPVTGETTDVTDKCDIVRTGEFTSVTYHLNSVSNETIYVFAATKNQTNAWCNLASATDRGMIGAVDMLNYEAIGKFIEVTHEAYKKVIGDEFGKTVPGVFTDEPSSCYCSFLGDNVAGPWNDILPEEFYKDHGYDLMPYVQALFHEPINDMERRARQNYTDTIKRLIHRNYSEQIAAWCRENNLIFTGHFGGEELFRSHIGRGDMQSELFYMDIPGIDSIYTSQKIDDNNFNLAGKLVSAVAKWNKKDRILCETYTISGPDYRLPEMKRAANRLMTLGVNMIQFMGAHYSNADTRKPFSGSVAGFFNPLLPFYHQFNSYVASVSYLSASTVPTGNVLLFLPLKQFRQDSRVLPKYSQVLPLHRTVEDAANALCFEGIGYDLISDELAEKLTVADGAIDAFGFKYHTAIFPSMENINEATGKLIEEMKKQNVRIIFIDRLPSYVSNIGKEYTVKFDMKPFADGILKDGNAYYLPAPQLPIEMDVLRSLFKNIIGTPVLNLKSDLRVYITERENDAAKVYFITNDENSSGTVYVDALPGMKLFRADTKEEILVSAKDGRLELAVAPYEMLVAIAEKSANVPYNGKDAERLSEISVITPEDNYSFTAKGGNQIPIFFDVYDKSAKAWRKVEAQGAFPSGMHLERLEEYKIKANIGLEYIPEELFLNIEVRDVKSITINGTPVPFSINTILWSEWDCKINIAPYLSGGANLLEITCIAEDMVIRKKPPFMFLSGDFSLSIFADVPIPTEKVIHSGGWEKQGYKYFSGTGIYKTSVNIDKPFKKAELFVDTRDVAEIYVNGKYAGRRIWAYENVDITPFVQKGENAIEIQVTSNLGNLLGVPSVNGILSPISVKLLG